MKEKYKSYPYKGSTGERLSGTLIPSIAFVLIPLLFLTPLFVFGAPVGVKIAVSVFIALFDAGVLTAAIRHERSLHLIKLYENRLELSHGKVIYISMSYDDVVFIDVDAETPTQRFYLLTHIMPVARDKFILEEIKIKSGMQKDLFLLPFTKKLYDEVFSRLSRKVLTYGNLSDEQKKILEGKAE
ncbi:MAG: hypothetical protein LBT30_07045 [Clostridiales bacterium]|jgi:hypothetical protein|nr:hypothetical protein [Clostridiales bacterium]